MSKLNNTSVLIFVDNLYEDLELWYPKLRLIEAGAEVVVAGLESGATYQSKHGYPCQADQSFKDVDASEFQGLILPGGWAPDKLRRYPEVLEITRTMHEKHKLIAHICHGGWIAASAGIMKGFKCTSTPGIKDDLIHAGAEWFDEPLVVDRNMISSRRPADLPRFCRAVIEHLSAV